MIIDSGDGVKLAQCLNHKSKIILKPSVITGALVNL